MCELAERCRFARRRANINRIWLQMRAREMAKCCVHCKRAETNCKHRRLRQPPEAKQKTIFVKELRGNHGRATSRVIIRNVKSSSLWKARCDVNQPGKLKKATPLNFDMAFTLIALTRFHFPDYELDLPYVNYCQR